MLTQCTAILAYSKSRRVSESHDGPAIHPTFSARISVVEFKKACMFDGLTSRPAKRITALA